MAVYTALPITWQILPSTSKFNWLHCSTAVHVHNYTYFMRVSVLSVLISPGAQRAGGTPEDFGAQGFPGNYSLNENRTTAAEYTSQWLEVIFTYCIKPT